MPRVPRARCKLRARSGTPSGVGTVLDAHAARSRRPHAVPNRQARRPPARRRRPRQGADRPLPSHHPDRPRADRGRGRPPGPPARLPHAADRTVTGGHRFGRVAHRATLRHGLPVEQQGDRHRPRLRADRGAAYRARHRLWTCPRCASRRARTTGAGRAALRPDDRDPVRQRRTRAPVRRRGAASGGEHPAGNRCRGGPGRGQRPTGACPVGRRDQLPRGGLRQAGPRSDRRRTDDVRPGELRTLPPQDIQRQLRARRDRPGALAVRDDQGILRGEPRWRAVRLQGQRCGHRGPPRALDLGRSRIAAVRLP